MQEALYSGRAKSESTSLVLLAAFAALLAGTAYWCDVSSHFAPAVGMDWREVRSVPLALLHNGSNRDGKGAGKEERPEVLVPSIAPLADLIPLSKVDGSAVNRNLLGSNAEKLVVIDYFSKKYSIDPLTMSAYIQHAIEAGGETRLEPLLLLAVMSIESNFNPLVESAAGAKGLMQVMIRIHAKKFEPYGGIAEAFRPEVNIRVGALILKQAIALMGSLRGGLLFYVGAAKPDVSDGGFAEKVLSEYNRLLALIGRGGQGLTAAAKPIGISRVLETPLEGDPDGASRVGGR